MKTRKPIVEKHNVGPCDITATYTYIPVSRARGVQTATFPEELARRCITLGSRPGQTVLDPFAGSGTTGRVAEDLGRLSICITLPAVGHG